MDKNISQRLHQLYGKKATHLVEQLDKLLATTPKINQNSTNSTWYKQLHLYIIYPAGLYRHDQKPFQRLIEHLDWIKNLGCNAIHLLPFMKSPLIDKGFDVSDYCSVRPELGTLAELEGVMQKAKKLELRIFMDLVINHVSDQHDWFQQAQQGNQQFRDYFLYSLEKPKFLRKYHQDAAVWADYEVEGKRVRVNIAFPERVGPIPHWRQGADGYWYYHTYTPQQPDLNWNNPAIFLEIARVLLYWTALGFNFRLDAIPFIGKGAYKSPEISNERTYLITECLHYLAKSVNPECALIIESYEKLDKVIDYFGTSNHRQSQLSYNFHLCTKIWVSLVKQDVNFLWQELVETNQIPTHAEWVNFLRNHDELSLAHLPNAIKNKVYSTLIPFGEPFREEYGISGRTYSLLGKNEKRFLLSYFLIASLPGALGIPYGDEIGMTNVPKNLLSQTDLQDSRNINRGRLSLKQMHSKKGQRLYAALSKIIKARKILTDYSNIHPERILRSRVASSVLAMVYRSGSSQLYVLINLSEKRQTCPLSLRKGVIISQVNQIAINDHEVILGRYAGVWIQI